MGDSFVVLNTNTSTGASVDTRTNTGGEHRQVVIIGEGAATSDAVVPADATNGLLTNPSDRAGRDMGKIDIAAFDVSLPTGTNSIGSVSLNSGGSLAITLASAGPLTVIQPTQGYLNATVFQGTGTNLHTVVDSGTITASVSNNITINSSATGSLAITLASSGSLEVRQPTQGYLNATVFQGTGSNLHVVNDAGTSWMGHVALASGTTVAITLSSSGSLEVRQPTQGYLNGTVFQPTGTNLHSVIDNSNFAVTFNSVTGSGTATSAMRVELPTNGTGVVGLNAGTQWIGTVALASGSTVTINSNGSIGINDFSGSLTVDAPVGTPVFVTPTPSTTGGWTPITITGLFLGSQGIIKGSAGNLGGYYIYNPNSSVAYCQIFDTVVAATVGTTLPKMTLGIPATSAANIEFTDGVFFGVGIRCAATTTASGSTVNASGLDCTFLFK